MVAKALENKTLLDLWAKATRDRGTGYFHQVITKEASKSQLYTVAASLRTAMRLADGLRNLYRLKPGDRVAFMAEGYGEIVPLYHAFWLLGCTIVAVPAGGDAELTATQINNAGCKVMVYSPALAARLASIIPRITVVEFWIVCGAARGGALGSGRTTAKLEDLLQNSDKGVKLESFPRGPGSDSQLALIAFTSGDAGEPKGVGFVESALVAAATNQASLYDSTKNERVASLLPDKNMVSLVHMLLVPLVTSVTSVVFPDHQQASKGATMMEEIYDNQISAVWMHEDRLDEARQASKSQKFVLSKSFRIFLVPRHPLAFKQIDGLETLVVTCYAQTEAGGVVAAGKQKGDLFGCVSATADETPLLATGTPIAGVNFKIMTPDGLAVGEDQAGELVIASQQVMVGYETTPAGACYLGPDCALHTADRVQWSFSKEGFPYLVPLGRDEQFIRRGKEEVSLFELESVLRRVVGVKDARVVGFSHSKYGKELGAFILLQKKAQVTREVLWSNLLHYFPWELVPKVFMIADVSQVAALPARRDVEAKLEKFSRSDFSKQPNLAP